MKFSAKFQSLYLLALTSIVTAQLVPPVPARGPADPPDAAPAPPPPTAFTGPPVPVQTAPPATSVNTNSASSEVVAALYS